MVASDGKWSCSGYYQPLPYYFFPAPPVRSVGNQAQDPDKSSTPCLCVIQPVPIIILIIHRAAAAASGAGCCFVVVVVVTAAGDALPSHVTTALLLISPPPGGPGRLELSLANPKGGKGSCCCCCWNRGSPRHIEAAHNRVPIVPINRYPRGKRLGRTGFVHPDLLTGFVHPDLCVRLFCQVYPLIGSSISVGGGMETHYSQV